MLCHQIKCCLWNSVNIWPSKWVSLTSSRLNDLRLKIRFQFISSSFIFIFFQKSIYIRFHTSLFYFAFSSNKHQPLHKHCNCPAWWCNPTPLPPTIVEFSMSAHYPLITTATHNVLRTSLNFLRIRKSTSSIVVWLLPPSSICSGC